MISKLLKILFVLGLIFVVGWLVYSSTTIILYILLGGVVSLIGRPLFKALGKVKIKHRILPATLRALISLLVIMGLLSLLLGYFLPAIYSEIVLLSAIDPKEVLSRIEPMLEWANSLAGNFGNGETKDFESNEILTYAFENFDLSVLPQIFNSFIGVLGNVLIAVFSIAFISFFFLQDERLIPKLLLSVTPRRLENNVERILINTKLTLSRYFLGLLIQILAISICIFIGLSILGVKNALLIACFTGVVNLVPYLGPWIGASFGIFILMANNVDPALIDTIPGKLTGLLVVFLITQLLDNYLFQPAIFSNSISAHPLEIFLVILVAGSIGGIGGMIAAIPVYAFLRIVFVEMNREFALLEQIKSK